MLLINSSVKKESNTSRVINSLKASSGLDFSLESANLPIFPTFTGEYIKDTFSLPTDQKIFIEQIQKAQDHLYFVPTYYKSMPGAFKNYLDCVQMPALYEAKRIGIISTNAKNQDYGARQFMQSLFGLLEFHGVVATVVPQILILSPDTENKSGFEDYLNRFFTYPVP